VTFSIKEQMPQHAINLYFLNNEQSQSQHNNNNNNDIFYKSLYYIIRYVLRILKMYTVKTSNINTG
jgi:hypothetical protein